MQRLQTKPWVVYAKTPLAGPAAVLEDLSRYTHRTAVSDERIVAIAGEQVLLRVRAEHGARPQSKKIMRIDGVEFIGRFLQHVLPPGFKRIRHYCVLASAHKARCLAAARHALGMPAPSAPAQEAAAQFMRCVVCIDIECCPHCHVRWHVVQTQPADLAAVRAIPPPPARRCSAPAATPQGP